MTTCDPKFLVFAIERAITYYEIQAANIDKANPGDPYASLMVREDIDLLREAASTLSPKGVAGELAAWQAHREPVGEAAMAHHQLRAAAEKVIAMNRQNAKDQYGDADKAESWACVVTLRAALSPTSASEPAAPSGEWQWVPKKPTPAMVKAGDQKTWFSPSGDCWAAMLAAAPLPSGEPAMTNADILKLEPIEMPLGWSNEEEVAYCAGFRRAKERYAARFPSGEPAPHQLMVGDVVRQCAYPDRGQYTITGMHGINNCWITVAHPYGPFRAHELERVPAEDRLVGSANGAAELIAKFKAGEPAAQEQTAVQAELESLREKLNTPEIHDFAAGVIAEAAHQRERWGSDHDAGKTPADWFWLVGYLAGKALHAQTGGNTDKALHHTISTAAALSNWHAAISGTYTAMRPGIDPVARGIASATPSDQEHPPQAGGTTP